MRTFLAALIFAIFGVTCLGTPPGTNPSFVSTGDTAGPPHTGTRDTGAPCVAVQQATEHITLEAELFPILDFQVDEISYQLLQPGLTGDATSPLIDVSLHAADFSIPVTIYDSNAQPHELFILFEQVNQTTTPAETAWLWSAVVDGGEVDLGGGTMGSSDRTLEIASGAVVFDASGSLVSFIESSPVSVQWPGSAPWHFDLQGGMGLTTQGFGVSGWADPAVRQDWLGSPNNGAVHAVTEDSLFIDNVTDTDGNGTPDDCES